MTVRLLQALAAALMLSACCAPDHDGADVAFVTNMIPHHQQALELSGLVPTRSSDPAVIKLASGIAAAQQPQIQTMKGWLAQWGSPPAVDHPMTTMPGMVDQATMTRLRSLSGRSFDTLWLQSMIGHHRGAVDMARAEISDGDNDDALAMADSIVTTQQAEIDQMTKLLGD